MVNNQIEKNYNLTIVDQNSKENGTNIFLENCRKSNINIIKNKENVPLNKIWNEFRAKSNCDILSFLNNDILIPKNFLQDNTRIFSQNDDIGIVVHVTNNLDYNVNLEKTVFETLTKRIRQGWDFSIRKECFVQIPNSLDFYCGDDFLFENVYDHNKKVAICLSSPIIHLLSQTRKNNKIITNRNPIKDIINYKLLGYKHYLNIPRYSKLEPPRSFYDWCDVAQNSQN